jgi:hypothetical protein
MIAQDPQDAFPQTPTGSMPTQLPVSERSGANPQFLGEFPLVPCAIPGNVFAVLPRCFQARSVLKLQRMWFRCLWAFRDRSPSTRPHTGDARIGNYARSPRYGMSPSYRLASRPKRFIILPFSYSKVTLD